MAWPGEHGGLKMTARRLLKETAFDPETVAILTAAYDECIRRLRLVDREDPLTQVLANKIIETAWRGEHDPTRVCQQVLDALGA